MLVFCDCNAHSQYTEFYFCASGTGHDLYVTCGVLFTSAQRPSYKKNRIWNPTDLVHYFLYNYYVGNIGGK